MNILIVNYEYPPLGGGGAVAVASVARELATRHRVHVLTSWARGLPMEESVGSGDLTIFRSWVFHRNARPVASIPSMLCFYPFGIARGKRMLKEYTYDVVNTWFAIPSGPTGAHLASRAQVPHVLTIIGGDIYDPSKWYSPHRNPILKRVVRSVLHKADGHIAISKDVAARAKTIYNFERPIEVAPLGVNAPQFPPASRKQLGLDEEKVYVVTVGRLVRRKSYHTLLRSLHLLRNERVRLLMLGEGPERESLKALADKLDIAGQVHFMGFVAEDLKYQLLTNSDIFSLTSLHEGFGLVYVEAMHCGLPVIAATTGGQTDFLEDGTTGYLVPSNDAHAQCQALAKLVGQPQLRRSMGSANRIRAKRYTATKSAQNYEALLARFASSVPA